jgi:tRNA U34 5-methylaminomethyl-2-thiouridine-forming methyltransferase MnmC
MISKVVSALSTDGVFVTYCAKGQLKRDLRALGLELETLPGPPGKKEMVRAIKRN